MPRCLSDFRNVNGRPSSAWRGQTVLAVLAGLGGVVLSAATANAGSSFIVGTFSKSTNTSVPVSQDVAHGLGVAPKALILWTSGSTDESFMPGALFGFGITDGTTSQAIASGNIDGASASDTGRRLAAKAITVLNGSQTLLAEADLSSWDSTNFTLSWTTNNSTAYEVHFLAIGGTDISAKVVAWTMPTSTGNKAVTGVGFKPDLVLHAHLGGGFTSAPPANSTIAGTGLGFMDASGDQWAYRAHSFDESEAVTDSARTQSTAHCLISSSSSTTFNAKAAWVSMDSDGFTTNFSVVSASAGRVISLALKGLNAIVGSFSKSTSTSTPVSQSATGFGFQPAAAFLLSVQNTSSSSVVDHYRIGLGATDGTHQASSAFTDTDNLSTTSVDSINKTSKCFVKVNNNSTTIDAEAGISSLDSGGFTLSWSTNDAVATEICYVALGPLAATSIDLESFAAAREGEGVRVEWRTGYEADNLGFHVWREERGQWGRLTPGLIAGTALIAGHPFTAGRGYGFLDPEPPRSKLRYALEEIDLSGQRRWHGPIDVSPAAEMLPRAAGSLRSSSPALAALGRPASPGSRPAGFPPGQAAVREPRPDPPAGSRDLQFEIAAAGALKVSVPCEGWYRIPRAELLRAGLPASAIPRFLRLCSGGTELPLLVDGGNLGRPGSGDGIEFYARGFDSAWEGKQVLWLLAGNRPGLRIRSFAAVGKAPRAASFEFTAEVRPTSVYFAALRNGEAENFFGPVVTADPVEETLTVHHVDPSRPAAHLQVSFRGVSAGPHRVRVVFEGVDLGDASFEGQERGTIEAPIERIRSGTSRLMLQSMGGDGDVSLFEAARLTWSHTYTADGDRLRCTVGARELVTARGFSSPSIRAVDITRPASPRLLRGAVKKEGATYSLSLTVPGPRTLLIQAGQGAPFAHVVRDRPSRWNDIEGTELLVIAPAELLEPLQPLLEARRQEGLTAVAMDVEDVYDEFSYGEKDPRAIRDLIGHALESWQVPPRFLLLVGDATFDPRDRLGLGGRDMIPAKLVDTSSLETASDDWFGDLDGDGVPEVAVGRLPVASAEETRSAIAKLLSFEAARPDESWSARAIIAADRPDGYDFEGAARDLAALLPSTFSTAEIFRGREGDVEARRRVLAGLASGAAVFAYLGHGSVDVLRGGLLASSDAAGLANSHRLPLVLLFDCLGGFYHDVYTRCLGEELLLAPGGGAVAVWASSGLTSPEGQAKLSRALFRSLFTPDAPAPRLGEAIQAAKRSVEDPDLRRTWILLGDPTLRLRRS